VFTGSALFQVPNAIANNRANRANDSISNTGTDIAPNILESNKNPYECTDEVAHVRANVGDTNSVSNVRTFERPLDHITHRSGASADCHAGN
jgi:hypothetical protein